MDRTYPQGKGKFGNLDEINRVGYESKMNRRKDMNKPLIKIKKAKRKTVRALIGSGILYIGDDGKLHVTVNTTAQETKAQ